MTIGSNGSLSLPSACCTAAAVDWFLCAHQRRRGLKKVGGAGSCNSPVLKVLILPNFCIFTPKFCDGFPTAQNLRWGKG